MDKHKKIQTLIKISVTIIATCYIMAFISLRLSSTNSFMADRIGLTITVIFLIVGGIFALIAAILALISSTIERKQKELKKQQEEERFKKLEENVEKILGKLDKK